jgi:hypothetical protein
MNNKEEQPALPKKHRKYILFISILIVIILGLIAGWYVYYSQHTKVKSLTQSNYNFGKQLSTLTDQLTDAQAAGNVSTYGWKTYCDAHGIFCFKYPPSWTISTDYSADVEIGGATITNPSKTLSVDYLDNYIKDGFAENFIFHNGKALKIGNNNLGVFGGYYVESVEHIPFYAVLNIGSGINGASPSDKAGENIFIGSPAGFDYSGGVYNSTIGQFIVSGQGYGTTQQANAWFNSIAGKTAYQIINSLYED